MNKYDVKTILALFILWVIFCIVCIVLSNDYTVLIFFISGFVVTTVLELTILRDIRKKQNEEKPKMAGFWVFEIKVKDYAWYLQDETYYFKEKLSLEQLNKYVDAYGRKHVCNDDSALLTLMDSGRYIGVPEKGEDVDMYLYYIEEDCIK